MAKLKSKTIHEKFDALYAKVEREGMGFHDQMISVANILRDHGVSPETAVELMHKASEKVTRRRPAIGEIERITAWSYQNKGVMNGMREYHKPKETARRNQAVIDEWASKGSLSSLKSRSKRIPQKQNTLFRICMQNMNSCISARTFITILSNPLVTG